MPVTRADELDARPADNAKELLARAQSFVDRKYVARSDERQRDMCLGYVMAERQDLARELAAFTANELRLSARQQASVEEVAKTIWHAGFKRAFDREPTDPWENHGEAAQRSHLDTARALLAKYDIFEKVEGCDGESPLRRDQHPHATKAG